MVKPAPTIDPRTAQEITEQLQALLAAYLPAEFQDPQTGHPLVLSGVGATLVKVFGRYAEIIIQRLNQMPDKNLLAFLNLLGASRLPPQPARVPLTFTLTAGSALDAVVPIGTQVAAPPAEGDTDPVIFETERELVVTAAQLSSLWVRDPQQDTESDRTPLTTASALSSVPAFRGNQPSLHVLYLGHRLLLGLPNLRSIQVTITLATSPLADVRQLRWDIWDGQRWQPTPPTRDLTNHLRQSGTLELGPFASLPLHTIQAQTSRWLRCQLLTPITQAPEPHLNMVRATQLPNVAQVELEVESSHAVDLDPPLLPELIFTNAVPVDIGQPLLPFGDKPQPNDSLYVAHSEAIAVFAYEPGLSLTSTHAALQLDITVANAHRVPTPTTVRPDYGLALAWECWTGHQWQTLGMSTAPIWMHALELAPLPAVISTEADADGSIVPLTTVVRGTVVQGATVAMNAARIIGRGAVSPVVDEQGHFAWEFSLHSGVNMFVCAAQVPDPLTGTSHTATSWVVVFRETPTDRRTTLRLEVPEAIAPPTPDATLDLQVTAMGADAEIVQTLRATNGHPNLNGSPPIVRPSPMLSGIPLAEGRNDLLIEALDANTGVVAATTVTVVRAAAPPMPNADGFVDGTYGLRQRGQVTLRLPSTVQPTAVNGQEQYWLRLRLANGGYGQEATYALKDPLHPDEGFTLVPATFRPPLIAQIRLGYTHTLGGPPDQLLAENNGTVTEVALDPHPFQAAPEQSPSLYLGWTLPPGRSTFPNRTLTCFHRAAESRYGARTVPISPAHSRLAGEAEARVVHRFWLTNDTQASVRFDCLLLGTTWPHPTVAPSTLTVAAGAAATVDVRVEIPAGTALGTGDHGILRITASHQPEQVYSATFETVVGAALPTSDPLRLVWQYWNGAQWMPLTVQDESQHFTRTGLIACLPPADIAPTVEFGLPPRYWLRVQWQEGDFNREPRLGWILANTTWAAQTVTIHHEILGSSDGSEAQQFTTTHHPVLVAQQLEVREPELPSGLERARLQQAEGEDAIPSVDATVTAQGWWVRWHEVPDFYGSGPRDRHYVLNHLTGAIRFGNGINGLIPPPGIGNLRLRRYQTGGGTRGNQPASSIVQLKTTIPYVDKVVNPAAATGGATSEPVERLLERAPRQIRHRQRAVTLEDYEDLAQLASPAVARAKCVPLLNLAVNPLALQNLSAQPAQASGAVSVVIIPHTTAAKPIPSLTLIDRVQTYLINHAIPTVTLSVVGPFYIKVDVTADLALVSLEGAGAVEQAVRHTLDRFLHPLTGGVNGRGWDFGREPHPSDFYALLESVPGVDHVRSLTVRHFEDQAGIEATGRFLVYSGRHTITLRRCEEN